MRLRVLLISLLLLQASSLSLAEAPISLSVTPAHQFAPGIVTLKIRIPKNYLNAGVCFGFVGPLLERWSCQEINGQYHPTIMLQTYTGVPEGDYIGLARLHQTPSRVSEARTSFIVLSNQ